MENMRKERGYQISLSKGIRKIKGGYLVPSQNSNKTYFVNEHDFNCTCPDILLTGSNTAVFLHGCFWHKCPVCYRAPKSNEEYWLPKIEANVKRDKKNSAALRKSAHLMNFFKS